MNRLEFIRYKRDMAEKRYDEIFSENYDADWGNVETTHNENVLYLMRLLENGASILDAACGTGKYFSLIGSMGYRIFGIDQSLKMLQQAKKKLPSAEIKKMGLQELDFENKFSGIMCVDAMENVFPEEWSIVLSNFHRALKKGGYLYFTVETEDDSKISKAYEEALKKEYPIVYGEVAIEGYHYYPNEVQVESCIETSRFITKLKNVSEGYIHYIVQRD